jgi:hypothetical protein
MHKQRSIIHITVGSNAWQPTDEELDKIRIEFKDALADAGIDEETGVAVTRKDIDCAISTIDASEYDNQNDSKAIATVLSSLIISIAAVIIVAIVW